MIRFHPLLIVLLLTLPVSSLAGDVVGKVTGLSGDVTVRDDKAQRYAATVGMAVETGQMVKTLSELARSPAPWQAAIFSAAGARRCAAGNIRQARPDSPPWRRAR